MKKKNKIAYSGSLIAQDFSEGDENFHGYLLWNISDGSVEEIPIYNDWSFKNVRITPYIDFDDLDFEIDNPTKYMKVRFVWGTLPQTRNKDNERKIVEYLKSKHQDVVISHKNEFLETEKIDINENVTLENVTDKGVQHEIFREFLDKIGTDKQLIDDVIALDEEILKEVEIDDAQNIEWNIIKFGGKNFMSYEEFNIDWRDKDGLYQISGKNANGKTTILKSISYVLFGKTLETETRMKYGDMRFINNRNDANYCEAYIILEANGEYYGIKRRTEISKARDGSINGAPTTLSYYLLSSPDEAMDDNSSLEKLDDDRRVKTQKKIEDIIGTYDNFNRIVMTTSDTLNRILSNDMATFIDSLLYDSGLDIFDKKLEGFKIYQKRANEKSRVSCNIEMTNQHNATLTQEITILEGEINHIETIALPDVQSRITIGRNYVEAQTKKLFKIDPEIFNLDKQKVNNDISTHNNNISDYNARKAVIEKTIIPLKQTYNEKRLNELLEKKDAHKTTEYNQKLNIKTIEQEISDNDHKIEIINGDIFRLKQDGAKLKAEISNLKNSKVCSQCGQVIDKKEHIDHINKAVSDKETEMFKIADRINIKETVDKIELARIITEKRNSIANIQILIQDSSIKMENILAEIGSLTNDMNDVNKRKELQNELNNIPIMIQNEELKIDALQQKINNYDNSLLQIEENKKTEKSIEAAKLKIKELENNESNEKENIFIKKSSIGEKQLRIKNNNTLITDFKAQEYQDSIMNLYKKCVHRDGIPRQMLSNYIIPKINLTLENILSVAPFKIWLDVDDLKPRLAYHDRLNSVIDCISASGKERTFSSIVLKFALNQINCKNKPKIFLLDEIMGKLDENSTEEFIEILQLIKNNMKKVLIIEHMRELNPDYVIDVQLDSNGISSLSLNDFN